MSLPLIPSKEGKRGRCHRKCRYFRPPAGGKNVRNKILPLIVMNECCYVLKHLKQLYILGSFPTKSFHLRTFQNVFLLYLEKNALEREKMEFQANIFYFVCSFVESVN
jgi:hypothetical protein